MIPFEDYKVGLVMSCSGMNDRQHVFLRDHLKGIARLTGGPLRLLVPAVPMRGAVQTGSGSRALTERLVQPLRTLGAWLSIEVGDGAELDAIVRDLIDCDEVWCATAHGAGSEWHTRPSFVHSRVQTAHPDRAPRFKMLHYWVELPPRLLPSLETKRGSKRPPQQKG